MKSTPRSLHTCGVFITGVFALTSAPAAFAQLATGWEGTTCGAKFSFAQEFESRDLEARAARHERHAHAGERHVRAEHFRHHHTNAATAITPTTTPATTTITPPTTTPTTPNDAPKPSRTPAPPSDPAWVGGSGGTPTTPISGNWNASASWSPSGVPANGDALSFGGSGSTSYTSANDLSSYTLGAISLTSTATVAETIAGNTLTVSGSSISQDNTGDFTISNPFAGTTADTTLTLTGNGTGLVTLTGAIANGATNTVGITKNGASTFILQGPNTYTGATSVTGGTLKLGAAGALGNGTSNTAGVTVSSGAALDLGGFTPTANVNLNLNGTGISSGGALTNSGSTAVTYQGGVTLQSASSIGGTGNITLNGNISGAFGLTKVGADTLILNSFTNGSTTTTISAGTLQIGTGGKLGSGAVTDNAALLFKRDDAITIANAISGTGSVTQSGTSSASVTTLSGANTYTGATNVTSKTLKLGAAGALGDGTNNTSGVTVTSQGAALDLGGVTPTANVNLNLNGFGANSSSGGALTNTGSAATWGGTVTLQSSSSIGGPGDITLSNNISGAVGLEKDGADTLILTGTTNGSTTTTITAGTLQIGNGGTTGTLGTGAVTNNNATLSFNRSDTITVGNAISGSGSLAQIGPGKTILTGSNSYNGTTTISAGTLSLDSNGSTTARLANTSNITVNSGGTLLLANSSATASTDRINNSAAMTLNGGTFNTGGLSEGTTGAAGIGALTLQANSTIDLGSGSTTSILHFAASNAATWTASKILTISDWNGSISGGGNEELLFGTTSGGLTATQVAEIQFLNPAGFAAGTYNARILSTGEVIPIPEPGTWVGSALALAVIGYQFSVSRRRRCG